MESKGNGRSELYKFYLVSPKSGMDADALAYKFLSIKPVEEVFLTDGDYGYVLKVRNTTKQGKEPKKLISYIKKNGFSCSKAVSHYRYVNQQVTR